jgi:phosphoglycolate phosphatase
MQFVAAPFRDIRAVLFDLDGTLVETHIDFARMKAAMLSLAIEAGLDPAPLRGLDILAILAAVTVVVPGGGELRERGEQMLVEIELEGCAGSTLLPQARETLEWLRATGRRVAIVTRNSPAAVRTLLHRFPLPHDVLLTRSDVELVKPHPAHLWAALQLLGIRQEHAVMVGDHRMDIVAGRAAGTRSLALLTPGRPEEYFLGDVVPPEARPDGVIRSLVELRRWISP